MCADNYKNSHIGEITRLYSNLIDYKSDFYMEIVNLYVNEKLNNDHRKIISFYLLCDYLFDKRNIYDTDKATEVSTKIPPHCDLNDFTLTKKGGGEQVALKDNELKCSFKISPDQKEKITAIRKRNTYNLIIIGTLLEFLSNLESQKKVDYQLFPEDKMKFSELRYAYDNFGLKNLQTNFSFLVDYILLFDGKRFEVYTHTGIENLTYKIYAEFCLSLQKAEYLFIDNFTDDYLDQIGNKFRSILAGDSENDESSIEHAFYPELARSVVLMAAKYKSFCKYVEAHLSRKISDIHICLHKDVEKDILMKFPQSITIKFKKDYSDVLEELFDSLLEVSLIDHRFLITQENIQKLIQAKSNIEDVAKHIGVVDMAITIEDLNYVEEMNTMSGKRNLVVMALIKFSYYKVNTLLWKINAYLTNPECFKGTFLPNIVVTSDYKLKTLKENINFDHIISCIEKTDKEVAKENEEIFENYEIYNDINKYNLLTSAIVKNYKWFKKKSDETRNYQKLNIETIKTIYSEYNKSKLDENGNKRENEGIIVFSDDFLKNACNVLKNSIQDSINELNNKNSKSERGLKEIYELIELFGTFVGEFRKLFKFSEQFGYIHNQHCFEESFYELEAYQVHMHKKITIGGKYDCNAFPNNYVFIASTCFLPTYPNLYLGLFDQYSNDLRILSNNFYLLITDISQKAAYTVTQAEDKLKETDEKLVKTDSNIEEIKKTTEQERRNTIQILGIFAAILAFITASVGSVKVLNSVESYGIFAVIFIAGIMSLFFCIKLINSKDNRNWLYLLFYPIFIGLIIEGLYIYFIFLLVIYFVATYKKENL